ncbi:tail fiber domain-containing protein [Roseburia faecis]|uniref:tail fiber domain-containing protein n=1 Tax=Roseburia faecis TaxID=301302 RepID=UPI003F9B33A3
MIGGKNKELYYESSIDKQLNIEVIGTKHVIDNSMREQDTFTLNETLNDGTELKFGSCLPNQISFTGREVPIATKGMKLRVTETLEGNENDPFVYGTYTVQSDTPTADRTKRQIVAYDAMYDIINADVKSWYDGLSFPMTLKAFRDSFFRHLGIEQKKTSLVNDEMTVNKTLTTTQAEDSSVTAEATISGKTIIEAICEINGAFGNIGRGGRFEYVILKAITSALYPAEDLYPREDLFPSDANTESMTGHYITFDYEAFQSQAITQLEIRADDSTAGAIVGTAGNNYTISGNFLISDKTGAEMKQIANNLLPVIAQAAYTPIKSSECVGNPCLELGDPIRFNTSREIVESYILQRTLTGVQSKRDAILSTGTEKHAVQNQTTRETVELLKRRTHTLEETADHLQSTYEDLEKNTSTRFEQTDELIATEAKRATDAEGELKSSFKEAADSIQMEVNRKVGEDEIRSKFAMSPENVDIESGQINFKSNTLTIDSANFQLDEYGKVTIVDSLNFYSTALGDDIVIIGLDGKGRPMLQNMRVDLGSVTDQDGVAIGDHASTADHATTADSATTAESARQCIMASTAHYLQGIGLSDYVRISDNGNLIPSSSSVYCGTNPNPFAGGYSSGGWKTTSDRRKKKDFRKLLEDDRFERFFELLQPMEYRLIENDDKMHIGFVAQDVEQAMTDCGISENEFYGLEHAVFSEKDFQSNEEWKKFLKQNGDANDMYTLCYQEFIALNTAMIQKLQNRCRDFERRLSALERSVSHAENI